MYLIRLDLDILPFFSNKMALFLSWYIMFSSEVYLWYPKKYLVQSDFETASSDTTSLSSVELLPCIFCFIEKLVTLPFPRVITATVWPLQSLCIT